ncbi:MAG: putative toxin-antitoxin system toxin component, PIN family [Candidatus Azobacteroides sp.]|nr:putative toxin-antitoxin system toxin component, PIN family [Candidatus Azobacteroides sp.]
MLKVVLDTNILLSSISRKSPYGYILTALLENKYELYVSTEILLEYEEKIITIFDAQVHPNLRFDQEQRIGLTRWAAFPKAVRESRSF